MAHLGHSAAGAALWHQHAAQDRDEVIGMALSNMATKIHWPTANVRCGRSRRARLEVVAGWLTAGGRRRIGAEWPNKFGTSDPVCGAQPPVSSESGLPPR